MFAAVHHPDQLTGGELDAYLARGWFRMGPTLFTTNFLSFKDNLYNAVWLRVALSQYEGDRTQFKLFRINSRFTSTIQRATVTDEKEMLFSRYKSTVPFEASVSLQHLLFGRSESSVYDTYEVTVHDGPSLIAVGYFDLGETSALGISSFYHPDYRKYSLGKYLIYHKMNYCKQLGMQYFYPGYFVPGYSFFDYKLSMGKEALEFLQFEGDTWLPMAQFDERRIPLRIMTDRLERLRDGLMAAGVPATLMRYEFFDANLIPDLAGAQLFDFPVFLAFPGSVREAAVQCITFDARDQRYHMIRCRGIWKTNTITSNDIMYSGYVLKAEEDLYVTDAERDMIWMVVAETQRPVRTGTA